MHSAPQPAQHDKPIKLPHSAPRREKYTYLKLIERVSSKPMALCFEGRMFEPGAYVLESELKGSRILLELAGTLGKGRERESLYILWRWESGQWVEVGRAASHDAAWINIMREMVLAEMERKLVDVSEESWRICSELMEGLDRELDGAVLAVKVSCLSHLYEEVGARLAAVA